MNRASPLLPILAAVLGVAFLSLMDAFMKGASLAIGAFSAAWLRALFGVALALPLWLTRKPSWPRGEVMRLHLERGFVSAFMALTFFYSLTKLAIAEAIAISFVAPLVALYLARVLLGEVIRSEAIWASLLGFAGTLVIVGGKLGQTGWDRDTLLGLGAILISALLYAYNFIVIRKQSQKAPPEEITVFHSGVTAVLFAFAAPVFFVMPDLETAGSIGIAALLTVGGSLAIAWAYARAETQVLVPMEYSGFLWASLFGWLFFAEIVTATTIAGTLLIVIACLVAARRPRDARPEQGAL